jgi:hypothetical protein
MVQPEVKSGRAQKEWRGPRPGRSASMPSRSDLSQRSPHGSSMASGSATAHLDPRQQHTARGALHWPATSSGGSAGAVGAGQGCGDGARRERGLASDRPGF